MKRGTRFFVIFLASLVLTSFTAFSPQNVYAGEITYPVSAGVNIVTYRDITDTDPTPPVTYSLNQTAYNAGDTALLSIFDFNANIDVTVPEFISANVTQTSSTTTVNALETGPNTKIFNGTFGITDNISDILFSECIVDCVTPANSLIEYRADSSEAARAQITLPLSTGGNVHLSDAPFTESELVNAGIKPVTTALNVTLADGAAFSSLPTVKISFANANLDDGNIHIGDLEMWYKAPNEAWEKITDSCFARLAVSLPCDFFDNVADGDGINIESDPSGAGFVGTDGQGQYVLAIDVGLGGGGGGGLVRPGLVFNALAGLAGGGFGVGGSGGSAYSSPTLQLSNLVKLGAIDVPPLVEQMIYNHDATIPTTTFDLDFFADYEDFGFPLIINDKGFVLTGFSTTLETQTLKTNIPHTIKFLYYEADKIQHFSLYTNLRGANTAIHQSDTQIIYNADQEIQVIDPNGFFENVTFSLNELDDIKKELVFEITFANQMEKSDIIVRSWDQFLNSFDTYILDAIEVVPEEEPESPLVNIEEPIIEQLQSQTIPIWIKNNAAWWSEQQIGDDDFIAGIEYLIKNGIIDVPGVKVGITSEIEVPDWIKNNAGWWSDSLITDDDFIEAMQWLVANGVIQI